LENKQGINTGIAIHRIKQYIIFFWENHLEQHFKEEENLLFNTMNDDKIIVAIQQHKNIRGKIKALYENDITDTLLLQQLAEDLNHHIRYEERVLFSFF